MMEALISEMVSHACDLPTEEVCGLVASGPGGLRLVRGTNISSSRVNSFTLSDDAWLGVLDDEEVVAIYHSHVLCGPEPSWADRVGCEATNLPWFIVTKDGAHQKLEPCGWIAPLEGRPYTYMVHDCYTLVRDYYLAERGITLPEFDRPFHFWEAGKNVIEESFERAGFVQLIDAPLQVGDVLLMKVAARLTNHCAVYLGDGKIVHHVEGRLSKVDPLGGYWQKHVTLHVRHIDAFAK